MFVFDRSAFAVVIPLALLVAVVLWSNRAGPQPQAQLKAELKTQAACASPDARTDQVWAANLPSR